MDRRTILAGAAAAVSVSAAGCLQDDGVSEGGGTPTGSDGSPERAGDVFVVLHNGAAERVPVAVTMTAGDSVHFEGRTTVEPGGMQFLYPEVTERGSYGITVSVDGLGEKQAAFEFGEYDLEMGSNVVVWIDDEIRIGKEE